MCNIHIKTFIFCKMQQYTHTPETFSIFYNETNMKLKEHNDKLIVHNEKLEYYKETLTKYDNIIKCLENQNTILQEKNSALEHHVYNLDKYIYDLNRMMLKFFAYGKTPKTLNTEYKNNIVQQSSHTPGTVNLTQNTQPPPTPITQVNTTTPFSSYTPLTSLDTSQNKSGFTFGNK